MRGETKNPMMNSYIRLSKIIFSNLMPLAIVFIFSTGAAAQFETATVLGSVRDPNGASIEGAAVTLKNVATEITQTTTTDSNGDYQFASVKIGVYQVIVEANGFNKTLADKVEATINARQRVDLTLQVATATETVVVTDAATPLQPTPARSASSFSAKLSSPCRLTVALTPILFCLLPAFANRTRTVQSEGADAKPPLTSTVCGQR
jgi:hypothetical protein